MSCAFSNEAHASLSFPEGIAFIDACLALGALVFHILTRNLFCVCILVGGFAPSSDDFSKASFAADNSASNRFCFGVEKARGLFCEIINGGIDC